jgi:hypothetical protein
MIGGAGKEGKEGKAGGDPHIDFQMKNIFLIPRNIGAAIREFSYSVATYVIAPPEL